MAFSLPPPQNVLGDSLLWLSERACEWISGACENADCAREEVEIYGGTSSLLPSFPLGVVYSDRLKNGPSLGCVKRAPAARGGQDAGVTQPREHSLADPCTLLDAPMQCNMQLSTCHVIPTATTKLNDRSSIRSARIYVAGLPDT